MPDAWRDRLEEGDAEGAWDQFLTAYRRLLIAVARRYASDPDVVMDLFAELCERLHSDNLRRLQLYSDASGASATFSAWLLVVCRNIIFDWYRSRDGRSPRTAPPGLSPLGILIHRRIFIEGRSHSTAYELIVQSDAPGLSHSAYLRELRAVHGVVFTGRNSSAVIEPTEVTEVNTHGDNLIANESREILREAMLELPPDLRAAVWLHAVDHVGAAEVAQIVGWPDAKTVYNRVPRALEKVRRLLAARGLSREAL